MWINADVLDITHFYSTISSKSAQKAIWMKMFPYQTKHVSAKCNSKSILDWTPVIWFHHDTIRTTVYWKFWMKSKISSTIFQSKAKFIEAIPPFLSRLTLADVWIHWTITPVCRIATHIELKFIMLKRTPTCLKCKASNEFWLCAYRTNAARTKATLFIHKVYMMLAPDATFHSMLRRWYRSWQKQKH